MDNVKTVFESAMFDLDKDYIRIEYNGKTYASSMSKTSFLISNSIEISNQKCLKQIIFDESIRHISVISCALIQDKK